MDDINGYLRVKYPYCEVRIEADKRYQVNEVDRSQHKISLARTTQQPSQELQGEEDVAGDVDDLERLHVDHVLQLQLRREQHGTVWTTDTVGLNRS